MAVVTYYSDPTRGASGDDARIRGVAEALALAGADVHLYTLGGTVPRPFRRLLGGLLSRLGLRGGGGDLAPASKATLPLDEAFAALLLAPRLRGYDAVYVAGTMSVTPLLLRLLRAAGRIVFDPLANYARTLSMAARRSRLGLLRLALFLAIHKPQLAAMERVLA